jgi:hypothetical protein
LVIEVTLALADTPVNEVEALIALALAIALPSAFL